MAPTIVRLRRVTKARLPRVCVRTLIYLLCFTLTFSGVFFPGSIKAQGGGAASLKDVPVPVPTAAVIAGPIPGGGKLRFLPLTSQIVKNQAALIRLGKALFWDMQAGSDGITACASCHFNAGEDIRAKNQISPGLLDQNFTLNPLGGNGDTLFGNSTVPYTAHDPNNPLGPIQPPNPNFNVPGLPTFGPNAEVTRDDFPLNGWFNPTQLVPRGPGVTIFQELSLVDKDTNDVISSQGVRRTQFIAVVPGNAVDQGTPLADIFNVVTPSQLNLQGRQRRVEPRNAPSVINAVYFFDNFWDGRASFIFNGVNPFGFRDRTSKLKRNVVINGVPTLQDVFIRVTNSSLASQAVGPPLSDFEMSWAGRSFPELGRKMLSLRPLGKQLVHPQDSVLGPLSRATLGPGGVVTGLKGLNTNYTAMIRAAFKNQWWNSPNIIIVDLDTAVVQKASDNDPRTMVLSPGKATVVTPEQIGAMALGPMQLQLTQMEYNFSLFWGLAIQAYEATLISNDTPFDRFMGAPSLIPPIPPDPSALNGQETTGLNIFLTFGTCNECHRVPITSSFTVFQIAPNAQGVPPVPPHPPVPGQLPPEVGIIEFMVMADGGLANYDLGMYNISTRRTTEDIGRGGTAPNAAPFLNPLNGNQPFPLSYTALAALKAAGKLPSDVGRFVPTLTPLPRLVKGGAFKVPNLRNQEYRGPYLHNGDSATLRQVVEFYTRGGNFPNTNLADLAPDIVGIPELRFPEFDPSARVRIEALVAFLANGLTDQRVVFERAPFDHPQLFIPNGSPPGNPEADVLIELPPVGSGGRTTPISRFLNLDPQDPGP
jgi:cytochrome c peroxidase